MIKCRINNEPLTRALLQAGLRASLKLCTPRQRSSQVDSTPSRQPARMQSPKPLAAILRNVIQALESI